MATTHDDGRHEVCITVGKEGSAIPGFTGADIQKALDEAHRLGGGRVLLSEGTFRISAPLKVGDRTHLCGAGESTLLLKTDGVHTELLEDADYGETCVTVKDASGFAAGMGFQLYDRINRYGWDEFAGTITAVDGNRIAFEPFLHRDYRADEGGIVTNACSLIECVSATGASISDLALDGGRQSDLHFLGGCRGGGVYLYQAKHCTLSRLKVKGFAGDGISWQMTEHIRVSECTVENCRGAGLHPGAGSYHTVVERCRLAGNRGDGIYVCWRVRHGKFIGNECCGNEGYGISIGHRDTHNEFSANRIWRNVRGGILFRPEKDGNAPHHNRFAANIIEDNGGPGGGYGFHIHGNLQGLKIEGNVIRDTGTGAQRVGVCFVQGMMNGADIRDNVMAGHDLADIWDGGRMNSV